MGFGSEVVNAAFAATEHRPWPVPMRPWVMRMRWSDLLFAHWRVDAAAIAAQLPPGLEVDRFDGEAWLGVVPFRMSRVSPRLLPDVPGFSEFPELNLRTYVCHGDRPGVWFFTLEAASRFAVRAARRSFHLPYHDARMRCDSEGGTVRYASERIHRGARPARFEARYGPVDGVRRSSLGTLESWFTERYCLYAAKPNGTLLRGEIHHPPWPLQHAEAEISCAELLQAHDLTLEDHAPILHFARQLDVLAWWPTRVSGSV